VRSICSSRSQANKSSIKTDRYPWFLSHFYNLYGPYVIEVGSVSFLATICQTKVW
jgi:hypothetical protein